MSLIAELGPLLFLAAALGLLAARLRQPPLLGYILAGVIAGSGLFGAAAHAGTLGVIGELGITLLLFYLGLELSWHRMAPIAGRSFVLALVVVGVPFLLLQGILLLAGVTALTAAMIAFILSINSTAVAVQALEARGLFSGRLADLVIGINLIVDILAIAALAAFGLGGHGESSLGGLLLRIAGFGAVCATIGLAIVPRLLDAIQRHPASRLLLPISLLAIGLTIAGLGEKVGVPVSVGAFLAGVLAAEAKEHEALADCLHPIKEIFLGLFFVSVGFRVVPASLLPLLPMALGAAALLFVVRFLAVTAAAYASGEEADASFRLGAALGPIGEFSILLLLSTQLPDGWNERLLGIIVMMMFLMSFGVEPIIAAAPDVEARLLHRSPGPLRHLLYILRGSLAPAFSPFAPKKNPIRDAFGELVLTILVLVGIGVGVATAAGLLNAVTPAWLDFAGAGQIVVIALLVPGLVLLARRWRHLMAAIVGKEKEGPAAERVRLIQRSTRGALSALALLVLLLATLPLVLGFLRESRGVVLFITVGIGLTLALLFRREVLRLHHLLAAGLWGNSSRRKEEK